MEFNERKKIIESIKYVDEVIDFDDSDGSCISALEKIKNIYPNADITFCNGGDRSENNIPEKGVEGIKFIFGVGGTNKKNSSSWILKNWQYHSKGDKNE